MSEPLAFVIVIGVMVLLWKIQGLKDDVQSLKSKQGLGSNLTVHVSRFLLEDLSRSHSEPPIATTACGRTLLPSKEERLALAAMLTSDADNPDTIEPTCPQCAAAFSAAIVKRGWR